MGNGGLLSRRSFCAGAAGTIAWSAGIAQAQSADIIAAGTPVLTRPKIVGPIPVTATSKPYMTSTRPGSFAAGLLEQYDYVEEEYFLFGYANVYGPGIQAASPRTLNETEDIRPLGGLVQPRMPYATRLMVTRPRDNARFSGRVLAYTFHNLFLNTMIEPNFLRGGDAIVGVEGCAGARYGPSEQQRGGIVGLHEFDLERYRDLHLVYANPLAWPNLGPGKLSEAMKTWVVGDKGVGGGTQLQEQSRGYAQAPDIMTQMAHALKTNHPSLPFEGKVRRLVTYAASGGSTFLTRYIDYHHEAARLPDGRPAFDGFMVAVGLLPHSRPKDSVLAYILSEGDTGINLQLRDHDPEDTDDPRFRVYQVPGTGHIMSAALPGAEINPADRKVPEGVHYYDKLNKPLLWGVWQNMYDWIDRGKPMPKSARITIDNNAPDRIARDKNGNALGGLRTPWVDVPDGTYIGRLEGNILRAGYRPFGEDRMRQLYGSRENYVKLVDKRVDRMVRDGWVMAQDADLMKSCVRAPTSRPAGETNINSET